MEDDAGDGDGSSLSPSEFDIFDSASLDDLLQSRDRDSTEADDVWNYVVEKQKAKVNRSLQENEMRTKFFRWASRTAAAMISANFVIFAGYLWIQAFVPDSDIPDPVMLAWISATVVEILGIVAIIARYLFPGPATPKEKPRRPATD